MTSEKLWNYSLNGHPAGPVDGATLRILIAQGILDAETLIWQEGMKEWLRIGDSLFAAALTKKRVGSTSFAEAQPTAAHAQVAEPLGFPPLTLRPEALKNPYLFWLVLFGLNICSVFFSVYRIVLNNYSHFIWLRFIFSLLAAIPMLILFSRCWKIIQDGSNDIRPREAVGLLFVPGYHLYWFPKVFIGLSRSLNRFIEAHFTEKTTLRRSNTMLITGYCAIALINIVFSAFAYFRMESLIYFADDFWVVVTLFVVIVLAYAGITIAAMTDLYLTSNAVLEERISSNFAH
jgi:hypothetical protein